MDFESAGAHHFCRHRVQRSHGPGRCLNPRGFRQAFLDCGRDYPGSQRLSKNQCVEQLCVGIGEHVLRMNHSGHGIAKLDLRIAHAVTANDRAVRLHHLGEPACEYLLQNFQVAFLREAEHGQRAERTPAHGINIAQ